MADFVPIAKVEDVKEGQILAFYIDEVPLALTCLHGQIVAFGDVCTHDGGPLAEGEIEGDDVVCPRHGAHFNLFTGQATFPAPTPIPIYEVAIEGEDVKVKLELE